MNPGVGQGITNAFNNYNSQVEAGDAAQMRQLQMQQLKKAIAQQDVEALKQLKIDKDSQTMSGAQFDENGNLVNPPNAAPVNGAAPAPKPPPQVAQPPAPGQASIPNPANQPPMPPQQMQPPALPQAMPQPIPPQAQAKPMPPQTGQAPMPIQKPLPPPPYQTKEGLMNQPSAQPQVPGAPPSMDAQNAQAVIGQAKQEMLSQDDMKDLFSPIVGTTQKKYIQLRKAYPGLSQESYIKALGFSSIADMDKQVNKETDEIEKQRDLKVKMLDTQQSQKETKRYHDAEIEDKKQLRVIENAKLALEKKKLADNGTSNSSGAGDAAKAQEILSGVPRTQIVSARGSKGDSEYNRYYNMAVGSLMSEKGMTAKDAGDYIAHAQKTYKAEGATETAITKRTAGIELGINEIKNDINTLMPIIDKYGNSTPKILNTPLNVLRTQSSDPGLAQLNLAANVVATKYERALTGGLLSVAQLHSGAAEDAKKILNGDMSIAEMKAKIPLMQRELDNSLKAGKEAVGKLSGKSGSAPSAAIPDGWSVKEH